MTMILIPLTECVPRRVYKLRCRNLTFGVYTGEGGFVGIRTKFSDRYLDTEYHWDFSERIGTVRGMELTEHVVPDHIKVATIEGIRDQTTGRWLVWSHEVDNPNGGHLGKGWWTFADDGSLAPSTSGGTLACSVENAALFTWLDQLFL